MYYNEIQKLFFKNYVKVKKVYFSKMLTSIYSSEIVKFIIWYIQ